MCFQLKFALIFGMVAQIIVAAVGNAFQLFHAMRKLIFYIIAGLSIVCQIIVRSFIDIHMLFNQTLVKPPLNTGFFPFFMPFHIGSRGYKILQFGLFKFTHAENEVARSNFVTERLTDLGNTKRKFAGGGIYHIFELRKNSLSSFRTQIGNVFITFYRTDLGFKHQVKRTRFSQIC